MGTESWGFRFPDSSRGGTIVIAELVLTPPPDAGFGLPAMPPAVYTARFVPAEPGSDILGFGPSEADAITDLLRAERDLVRLTGQPAPEDYTGDST